VSVEYKVKTEFQGSGFKSVAKIKEGEMNDLELLYMAYGSLHITASIWSKLVSRTQEDGVEYPYDNILIWSNIMSDMMDDVKAKMAKEGLVHCSCEDEVDDEIDEDGDKLHQSFLQFSTNWNPDQLN
jgi:hypothetical protein